MSKSSKKHLPTLLGIFLLLVGISSGVVLLNAKQIFKLGAQGEIQPKNVRVTNVTETGFNISFVTDIPVRSFIKVADDRYFLGGLDIIKSSAVSDTHYFSVIGLTPETNYFVSVNVAGEDFFTKDPVCILTGQEIGMDQKGQVLYGKVYSKSGEEADGVIVYAQCGNGGLLSTVTSDDGNFAITASKTRVKDGSSYERIDENKTLIQILAQKGVLSSVVTAYLTGARPLPPIILGSNQDARNIYNLPADAEVPSAKVFGAFTDLLPYPFLIKSIYNTK